MTCQHLGPPTGELIDCAICGGAKQIAVHQCALHGICSPNKPLQHRLSGVTTVVPWCRTCPDGPYARQPSPAPAPAIHFSPRAAAGQNNNQTISGGCGCCSEPCCQNELSGVINLTLTVPLVVGGNCPCIAGTYTLSGASTGGTSRYTFGETNGPCNGRLSFVLTCNGSADINGWTLATSCANGSVSTCNAQSSGSSCNPFKLVFNMVLQDFVDLCCSGQVVAVISGCTVT